MKIQSGFRGIVDSTLTLFITRLSIPLLLGLAVWMASSVNSLQQDMAHVQENTKDVYTQRDAKSDFALRDALITRNTTDITKLWQINGQTVSAMTSLQVKMNELETAQRMGRREH